MRKSRWIGFMALLCLVCSCSSVAKEKSTLNINLCYEPTSLDPLLARNLSSLFLVRHLHEGLFRYKQETVEKALADHYEVSADCKTYRISLKEALYHDGSKIRAEDFIASARRALRADSKSDYAHLLFVIKNAKEIKEGKLPEEALGLKALAENCLEYTLEYPYADFIALLTNPIFFPTKITDKGLCFSGPFVLAAQKPNQLIELKKNPTYYDKEAVHLMKIKGHFLSNETAYALFKNKELDFVGSPLGVIPPEALDELASSQRLHKQEWLGVSFIRVNTLKAPLNDKLFRQRLNLAIERTKMAQQVLGGHHIATSMLVPALFGFQTKELTSPSYLFTATQGLQQPLTLKFSAADQRSKNMACVIKSDLEACGIQLQLVPRESKMLLHDLSIGDYDLMIGSWMADIKDPENFLELFSAKELLVNGTGWENERYTQLLKLAKNDPVRRQILLEEAQNILLEASPIIPLFQFNLIYATDEKLEGYSLNSLGILDFKGGRL